VTLPLFDPPPTFDRDGLAARLRTLADENIYIGTSSWKYEGWLDQIYYRDRYESRGKFSQKRFEAECLAEYADVFPVVCGDFTFYQFPAPAYWRSYFNPPSAAPVRVEGSRRSHGRGVSETRAVRTQSGNENVSFLNAEALKALFLEPLEPYRERVVSLIFEFGARSTSAREFIDSLDPFLAALPERSGMQSKSGIERSWPRIISLAFATIASRTSSMPGRECRH